MPKPRDRAVYKTGSPLDTNQHAEKESLQKKKKKIKDSRSRDACIMVGERRVNIKVSKWRRKIRKMLYLHILKEK